MNFYVLNNDYLFCAYDDDYDGHERYYIYYDHVLFSQSHAQY